MTFCCLHRALMYYSLIKCQHLEKCVFMSLKWKLNILGNSLGGKSAHVATLIIKLA